MQELAEINEEIEKRENAIGQMENILEMNHDYQDALNRIIVNLTLRINHSRTIERKLKHFSEELDKQKRNINSKTMQLVAGDSPLNHFLIPKLSPKYFYILDELKKSKSKSKHKQDFSQSEISCSFCSSSSSDIENEDQVFNIFSKPSDSWDLKKSKKKRHGKNKEEINKDSKRIKVNERSNGNKCLFTPEEDSVLFNALHKDQSNNHWHTITQSFSNRSSIQCIRRSLELNGLFNLKPWTSHEDQTLQCAVQIHGTNNWLQVANALPQRKSAEAYHRWMKKINPAIVRGKWNYQEDIKYVLDFSWCNVLKAGACGCNSWQEKLD